MDQVPEPEPEIEPPRPALPVAPGAPLSGLGGTVGTPALAALAAPVLSLGDGGPDQRPNKTLAVPVRMHLLANLCRLADRPAPTLKLTESEVQAQVRALLAELAARGEAPVWVLIDALNQCDEPAALLAGLPRDLPTNLYLIATTQPVATVLAAVDEAGRNPWRQIALAELDRALTAELALFDWPAADRARLAGPLPDDLLDALKDTAVGLPLLVREWGRDLYQRWREQGPAAFAAFRRALADADRNQMPPAYRRRLDQARAGFDPKALPDLLLWALALLARPLDLARLYRAVAALRPHFPGTRALTKADCQAALARLGGFLATGGPPTDPRWRALHPRLGAWFVDLHGGPERNFALREALVPLGAGPDLADSRSLAAWAARALDGEAVFYDLNAALRLELLDRLLAGLPDGAAPLPELVPYAHRRAGLAARRAWELHETGDKEGAAGEAEGARVLAEIFLAQRPLERQPDLCQDLSLTWNVLGIIAWHTGDKDRALAACKECLRLRQDLRDRFPAAWTWRRRLGLAAAYQNLGIALGTLTRHEKAIGAFDRAIEQLASLDRREPEVRQALGDVHQNRGVALANLQRHDEALGADTAAIGLYETLDQDQPIVRELLGKANNDRGITLANLQRYEEAIGAFDRAIGLYETLNQDQSAVRESLGKAHRNRGLALANLRRHDDALGAYDRAIGLYETLDQEQPSVRQPLGDAHRNCGNALAELQRYHEALGAYDHAIALYETLHQEHPTVRQSLGDAHHNCGAALANLQRHDEALGAYDRAIGLYETLGQEQPAVRESLGKAHYGCGTALANLRRYDEAIGAYDRAIGLYETLGQEQPAVRESLGKAHHGCGIALANLRRYDEALRAYYRAIRLYETLDQEQPTVRQPLGDAHHNCGIALANLRRYDEALGTYYRAIRLYETLDQDQPTVRQSLGNAHYSRGFDLYSMARLPAAFEALDRVIALGNGDAQRLRNSLWRLWSAEGLSRPPETFTGTQPDTIDIDWEPAPLIGGNWIALTGESARPHLDALWSLLGPLGPADLRGRIAAGVGALRGRSLACYPGWTLCEVRLVGDGGPGALAFLSGPGGAVLLSGVSTPVHGFNQAIGLSLSSAAEYLDYLKYFCGFLRADEGRFQIVEAVGRVPWRADADPACLADFQARFEPPRVVAVLEGSAEVTAYVLYGGRLYRDNFEVQAHGMVDMISDKLLADVPLAQIERFDGPIRLPPVDAPPDPQEASA